MRVRGPDVKQSPSPGGDGVKSPRGWGGCDESLQARCGGPWGSCVESLLLEDEEAVPREELQLGSGPGPCVRLGLAVVTEQCHVWTV